MCFIYGLTPSFIRFKLAYKHLTSPKVKKFQRELLSMEYSEKLKNLAKIKKELNRDAVDGPFNMSLFRH